jgi:hypothetical protein
LTTSSVMVPTMKAAIPMLMKTYTITNTAAWRGILFYFIVDVGFGWLWRGHKRQAEAETGRQAAGTRVKARSRACGVVCGPRRCAVLCRLLTLCHGVGVYVTIAL